MDESSNDTFEDYPGDTKQEWGDLLLSIAMSLAKFKSTDLKIFTTTQICLDCGRQSSPCIWIKHHAIRTSGRTESHLHIRFVLALDEPGG
jgi:hypothetical protein